MSSSKRMVDEAPMRILPSNLRFDSIKPGVLYAMSFSIVNATKVAQRIRIQSPKNPCFALNYIPSGAVAPGLDIRAEIECQIPQNYPHNFVSETIIAYMGPHQMEIPVFASKPCANVVFDPVANLGLVAESQSVTHEVMFENTGDVEGEVEITFPETEEVNKEEVFSISPAKFVLKPKGRSSGSKQKVEIKFVGGDLGSFRELMKVHISGYSEPLTLDISAQTVQQRLSLLQADGGGFIDNLEFGTVFYGQTKSVKALLVNNGPQQINYFITYASEDDDALGKGAGGHGEDQGNPAQERSMVIVPSEGIIQPFAQIPVTVRFFPEMHTPGRGFIKKHLTESYEPKFMSSRASIECAENGKGVTLTMQGTAVVPSYTISPTVLRFDSCPVYDRRDILVTLTSKATVPFKFDFTKVAQFKLDPIKGELQPNESVTIVASFTPGQLGHFASKVKLSVANGLRTTELHLIGDANDPGTRKKLTGGPKKMTEEFQTQYKFVDTKGMRKPPTEGSVNGGLSTTFSRIAPWESKEFLASNSWDEVYASTGGGKGLSGEDPTYSVQGLQRRQAHKEKYNNYLQQSHAARVAQKEALAHSTLLAHNGPDRQNPNGVDMGMERGIEEPTLRIPKAGEPLWLANAISDEGGFAVGGRSRIPLDESRLIQKKYHDQPRTQAEIRDCSTELGYEDLKLVISSHKILNFGRVCINSITARNFAVTNDLQQSILVKLESSGFEPELRQSHPDAQVIPGGAAAGFDIYFQCHDLGKYKKTFSWSINGYHTYKVGVVAEVVPIELKLDKTSITMEFPEDSMERSISEDVVLSNPGNALAEFLWGANGAFQCNPERGVIDPGHSAVIKVIWTPKQGKSNDDELGLHISGGVDQALKVVGVLKEAKADFDIKKLSMGVVAVGMELKMVAHIKNSSQTPAVFHMDQVDEKYGIALMPSAGRILPGESFPISVQVNPKAPMSYEGVVISADIRGGKSASLRLSGESKIPDLEMVERKFDFGKVIIGSEFRLPFTLHNRSNISACLILDLSEYPEFTPSIDNVVERHQLGRYRKDKDGNILEPYVSHTIHPSAEDDVAPIVTETVDVAAEGGGSGKVAVDNCWKLTISSGSTFSGEIIFTPAVPCQHDFSMQLFMEGLENKSTDFSCSVTADGMASRLGLSAFTVDFGDRVVSRDPSACMTYYKEFTLQNMDVDSPISFVIRDSAEPISNKDVPKNKNSRSNNGKAATSDNDSGSPPVFVIFPTENSLPAGVSIPMRVTFLPQNNGEYKKKLHIFIDGQPDPTRPYLTLTCQGSGVFPRLSFDKPSISLPAVPLGISSRASFVIHNNGYDNLPLQYRVSPTIPVPLDISFPDGQELGLTVLKANVVVSCRCDSPVSWSGKIEFFDNDGEKFSIDASGVSDCSLFTTYSFTRAYSDIFGFVGIEDQPIRYMTKKEIMTVRLLDAKHREHNRRQLVLERQKQKGIATDAKDSKDSKDTKKIKGRKASGDDEATLNSLEMKLTSHDGDYVDGVLLQRDEIPCITDDEISILMKWLNKYVCRKPFDLEDFMGNILDTHGDIVVDCIEQMSGRKIPGLSGDSGHGHGPSSTGSDFGGTGGGRPETASLHAAQAYKLINKYKALLHHLIRTGALLNHIKPICMLDRSLYIAAAENELRRSEGERLTPAFLEERKSYLDNRWSKDCKQAWAEILFQCIKVFILGKLSYAEFAKMPGVVVNQDFDLEASLQKGKKKSRAKFPPEFAASNVHSHGEAVLLAWAGYHIHHAKTLEDEGSSSTASSGVRMLAAGTGRRVIDIDAELSDFYGFCQITHSHMPEATHPGGPLSGYTVGDHSRQANNFTRYLGGVSAARLNFDATVEELSSGRGLLIGLLNLFFGLPCMLPKSTIEFRGILGDPIVKVIELKNPSKKRVMYSVTLEGNKDFTAESVQQLVVPPESSIEFPVTLTARFSDLVNARIIFWGLRDNGVAGSSMVFKLTSNIYARKPKETFKRTMGVYELETIHIEVKNPFDKECSFDLKLLLKHSPSSILDMLDVLRGHESKTRKNENKLAAAKMAALNDDSKNEEETNSEIEVLFKQPFWCSEYVVFLPAKGSKTISLNILPFMLGTYHCEMVLVEPKTGEFSYDIHVEAGFPKPTDKLDLSVMQMGGGVSPEQVLRLASKNFAFEKAVHVVTESRITLPARRAKAKALLLSRISTPIVDDETGQSNFIAEMISPYFICKKEIGFVSDYGVVAGSMGNTTAVKHSGPSNKFRKVHKTVLETPPPGTDMVPYQGALNTILFHVNCEHAGVYKTKTVLYAKDNHLDMRVLDMTAKVSIARQEMNFYFKSAARQKVVQEIAVSNVSNKDWSLSAVIVGAGFTGPKVFNVPKGETLMYNLSFTAPYAGNFNGSLTLKNSDADDNFEYKLFGVAEDPLVEDNLHFKCNARSKKTFTIPLQAIPRPSAKEVETMVQKGLLNPPSKNKPFNPSVQYFDVQTDLPYISGEPQIEVNLTGTTDYEFTVLCPVGGIMSGSMTFIDPDTGVMMWYIIDIEVAPPSAESTIKVESVVRKAVAVEITLENPTRSAQEFKIKIRGDGLIGDSTFVVPPMGDAGIVPYELIYSPLHTGNFSGSISFINDKIGEIWYKLLLTATPAPAVQVDLIECMVGSSSCVKVPIENPLPEAVTLFAEISDAEHFSVAPDAIKLGPYSQSSFDAYFRPSSLHEIVRGEIKLSHPKFGEVSYEVCGEGLLPGLMPASTVLAALGTAGSHTLSFRNPFPYPLPVDIVLTSADELMADEESARIVEDAMANNREEVKNLLMRGSSSSNNAGGDAFALLLRRPLGMVIAAKSTLQVGVSFTPATLGDYSCFVQIRSGDSSSRSLLWCYPLIGTAEAGTPQRLNDLTTPCKSSLIQDVTIKLEGLTKQELGGARLRLEDFELNTTVQNPQYQTVVTRALRVQPIEIIDCTTGNYDFDDDDTGVTFDYAIRFRLLFEPLKTFATTAELVLICKHRGRWRAEIDLISSEPEVDDTIELTAAVGGSDRVGFKLNNRFLGYSTYNAYFTAKSSKHFSVSPTSGVLAPYGAESGTPFVISFAPTEYGARERATLIIATDDVEWSYQVIGHYPDFNVHEMSIASKVDSGQSLIR